MGEINPYQLFKFIKDDVTVEKLHEATDEAYKDVKEGRLYPNLNNVEDPEEIIQTLKEKEKKKNPDIADNPEIKTDNAGVTEDPEKTKLQKKMDKETPDVEKKSDPEVAKGKPSMKDQKNKEVKVTGVTKEGRVPDNPNNVDNAEDYIGVMTEDYNDNNGEIIADGISEESVARDLARKNNGVAVMNPDTRLWSVKTQAQEQSSGSAGVVPASAARESVEECDKMKSDEMPEEKEEEVEESKVDEKEIKRDKERQAKEADEIWGPGNWEIGPEGMAQRKPGVKCKNEAKVEEERTSGDVAGQPDEASTSKAVHVQNASKARSNATDKQTADRQSETPEDQVGQGVANAQKIVQQSAARTKATDKQHAKSATSDITTDQGPKGKSDAQSNVNKTAAHTKSQDGAGKEAPMVDGCKKVKEDVEEPVDEAKVNEEDVDVTIKAGDKEVNVSTQDGSTQVTTFDAGTSAPLIPEPSVDMIPEPGPIIEPGMENEDDFLLDQEELSDEEALEMAEKLMVAEHLKKHDVSKLNEKQKKFLQEVSEKKFSKRNKEKIDAKIKEIK